MAIQKAHADEKAVKLLVIAGLVLVAFFASYSYASSVTGARQVNALAGDPYAAGPYGAVGAPQGTAQAGGAGCACCGPTGSGEPIEGVATLEGDTQRITVDTSNGYNPNVIKLKAGVPTEITFKAGQGCMGQVMSKDLGFFEDLTTGDKTVRLDGLSAGTYAFACGMEMVFGSIVVE